jgi:hypothetical protein
VRNYRAEVTLTPSPGGTLIRWGASWDRTIMGRLARRALHPADGGARAATGAGDEQERDCPRDQAPGHCRKSAHDLLPFASRRPMFPAARQ